MKSLITSSIFTFFISIGFGFKAEAQRLFDAVPEHIQFQNKLIEDVVTMSTDTSYNNAKTIVQPVSLPTPPIQDMDKPVYVRSYKVDYKRGTKYFPSSVEGEAFMRQLNNDYQKNMIPNPGNVNGYYTITLVQGLVDYGRWNTKALQIN